MCAGGSDSSKRQAHFTTATTLRPLNLRPWMARVREFQRSKLVSSDGTFDNWYACFVDGYVCTDAFEIKVEFVGLKSQRNSLAKSRLGEVK